MAIPLWPTSFSGLLPRSAKSLAARLERKYERPLALPAKECQPVHLLAIGAGRKVSYGDVRGAAIDQGTKGSSDQWEGNAPTGGGRCVESRGTALTPSRF